MDIINVLTQEHQRVMGLFEQIEHMESPAANDALFLALVQELSLHEKAEEAAIWKRLHKTTAVDIDLDTLVAQELNLADLLEELVVDLGSEDLHAWLLRVRELVVQHIQAEEKLAFPLIQQLLDARQRDRLGTDYLAAKDQGAAQMARLNVIMAPDLPVAELTFE